MSAIETWGEMVRVEHAQSDRMRGVRPTDTWNQFAASFKADPHRTDDHTVEALRSRLIPGETLLDIGAGGGRLALPLALTCRSVTAVEPSPSMCDVLRETASEYGIENVSIVESGWLDADVEPADVALCSHVVYVIEDIGAFVRKMDDHARRLVMAVVFEASPLSQVYGPVGAGPRRNAPRPAIAAPFPPGAGRAGHPTPGHRAGPATAAHVHQHRRSPRSRRPLALHHPRNRRHDTPGTRAARRPARRERRLATRRSPALTPKHRILGNRTPIAPTIRGDQGDGRSSDKRKSPL